ncbi:hypothetical protein DFA_06351 [Cavenderia fasciculata]|uniref:Glutathione S-transferase n=1 Tax=Cavenderia fasciculata TaxID=261658 RepID=F4PKT0_CACFS|nr:uncharacterized protein DFA_06351 [Cavenderia fasciculata]EGG24204.1 hypothetical protein DFA_06351 [Cavenderia fasciculata]|eukprot:XP_004362055.1 hypothetical protein DFA_06351 [Cavenderia fasciculata]
MSKLILYGDQLSQPTRAILFILLNNKIPHEFKTISIAKGEQNTEEFAKINPWKKVPVIQDGDLTLIESHTILRYIAQKYKLDQLYSNTDLIERCKVDMYLDWHHIGLRKPASTVFYFTFVAPLFGIPVNQELLASESKNLQTSLSKFESIWLGDKKFIVGDKATLADFASFTEISNLRLISNDYFDLSKYPKIDKWIKQFETMDGYQESHNIFNIVLAKKQ